MRDVTGNRPVRSECKVCDCVLARVMASAGRAGELSMSGSSGSSVSNMTSGAWVDRWP